MSLLTDIQEAHNLGNDYGASLDEKYLTDFATYYVLADSHGDQVRLQTAFWRGVKSFHGSPYILENARVKLDEEVSRLKAQLKESAK